MNNQKTKKKSLLPVIKVLRSGQVTLPAALRQSARISEGDLLMPEVKNGVITLRPAVTLSPETAVKRLRALFAKSRQAASKLSEAELKSIVEEACSYGRGRKVNLI